MHFSISPTPPPPKCFSHLEAVSLSPSVTYVARGLALSPFVAHMWYTGVLNCLGPTASFLSLYILTMVSARTEYIVCFLN